LKYFLLLIIFLLPLTYAQLDEDNLINDGKTDYIEGMMHLKGIHYRQNNQKAFELISKSAQTNHPKAQYQLATFYFKGITVNKDMAQAVYWLKKSAAQGYQEAQLVLDSLPETQKLMTDSPSSGLATTSSLDSNLATNIDALRQEIQQSMTQNSQSNENQSAQSSNIESQIMSLKEEIQQSLNQEQLASKLPLEQETKSTTSINPSDISALKKLVTDSTTLTTPQAQNTTSLTVETLTPTNIDSTPTTPPASSTTPKSKPESALAEFPLLESLLKQEGKSLPKPITTSKSQAYPQEDTQVKFDPGQQLLAQVMRDNSSPAALTDRDKKFIKKNLNITDPNNPTDAKKQFNLGLKYLKGTSDIKQDYDQAYYWFNKSAEQGNAKAQFNLATMYFKGLGIDIDNKSALKWYTKSAEQGEPYAQFNLGFMHLNGLSAPKDTKQAIEYFTQSAKSGVAKAQLSLGIIYLEGTLLKQDFARAAKWIQKSRVQGESQAESIWNKYELWKYWQIES